jgi:hypothetical protein
MESLDLIQFIGKSTCVRSIFDTQVCTLTESWNFGAMLMAGALISIALLLLRERSRQRRERNYF